MGRLFAATYDLFTAPLEALAFRRLRQRVVADAKGRVLEIGAGTGNSFPFYAPDGVSALVVTEPNPHMLRRALQRVNLIGPPFAFLQADAQALPFADNVFDTVVGSLVFCTIPDPRRALAEVRRVARPGAEMRLLEHVRGPHPWLGWAQDRIEPLWVRLAGGCHPNRDTLALARAAGLHVVTVVNHRLGFTILEIVALNP